MLETSDLYKQEIIKTTRSSSAKISFGIYDVVAKGDATPSVSTTQPFTDIAGAFNNIRVPAYNMATFEYNYFDLDGTFYLTPDNVSVSDNLGWWSLYQSNNSGVFSTPPVITILFSTLHTSSGITIDFDSVGGTYCPSFLVEWYNDTTLIDTLDIVDNMDTSYSVEKPVVNYDKVVITLRTTNYPIRYARVMEISFGVDQVFDGDTIISASILEEVDPSSSTLTLNTLKFTLLNIDQKFNMLNPEGVYQYLQKRQPLVAQSGLLVGNRYEWVDLGTYYLSDWKNSTGLTATLEATDVMGLLDKTTYYASEFWDNTPIQTVLNHIFEDAGLYQCVVEEEMESEVVNGYIPIMSHREAVQAVLIACAGTIKIARNGIPHVVQLDYINTDSSVDFDVIIGTPQIEQKPLVTEVQALEYVYSLNSSVEELYKSTVSVMGTSTLVIPFTKTPVKADTVSITVTGLGTISGTPIYSATSATVTIIGTGLLDITLTGKTYLEITRLVTLTNGEILNPQVATIKDNKLFCENNTHDVLNNALAYYSYRIKQTISYFANPALEAGDNVSAETMFGDNKNGIVESQELIFAPKLQAKLEVVG